MLAKHRPDITGSRDELLALKFDPNLSREMTEAYSGDNGAILAKAGHQPTPGNTYLAHFAGPQGAVNVLSADPSASAESVMGADAVRSNPFLRNMSVGDLRAWADRKVGGTAMAPAIMGTQQPAKPLSIAGQLMGAEPAQPDHPQDLQEAAMPPFDQPPPLQPIALPPRRSINLAQLKAALASGNRGLFSRG